MDFSKIDEAVDSKFDQASSEAEKSQHTEEGSGPVAPSQSATANTSEAQAILDLAKVGKFMIEGKEYTWDQLKNERLMRADYTRKTQELAEQRRAIEEQSKYGVNLNRDLNTVLKNPSLAEEFRRIYPKEYHSFLDMLLQKNTQQVQQKDSGGVDKTSLEKLLEQRLAPLQDKLDRYETEALVKQLDAIYTKLGSKYPQADQEFVTARLQSMDSNGESINEEKIEEVFKYFHERQEKAFESHHQERLKQQTEANKKAKDIGAGGGIPGQAPKKMKLFGGEIEKALENHLSR